MTKTSFYTPRQYINILMLLRVVGYLLIIESVFMVLPLIASLAYGEHETVNFLISMVLTTGVGTGLMCLRPKSKEMGKREAILLTSLTWVILSMFGMLPFLFSKTHMNVTDAFFETMSGFTTTGASILSSLENIPKGILLWRCVTQWIGGMGIILFTLAVVPMLNYQGGMQLFNAEVTGIRHDKLRPRVGYTAKGLWAVYMTLTIILIVCLAFSDMDIFDSICHGLSIMSTGGFSTRDMSIESWNSIYIKVVVMIFMFLGGVNFSLIFNAASGKIKDAFRNEILRFYIAIILIAYLVLCCNVIFNGLVHEVEDVTIDPLFQSISLISSTGLTEPDFKDWGSLSMIVLIILMFTGACAGSTSGGAKLDRFLVLFKFLRNEFYRMMHPNAVTTVSLNGKGTSYVIVMKVLGFLFLYVFVIMLCATVLVVLGLPLSDSFFCSLSAISNTGLGTDITGISGDFSLIPAVGKWMLALTMLIGRLELYTVLLLFTRAFWHR